MSFPVWAYKALVCGDNKTNESIKNAPIFLSYSSSLVGITDVKHSGKDRLAGDCLFTTVIVGITH